MNNLHSINREQGLYVLKCGSGFSCYGFDVVKNKATALAKELDDTLNATNKGTKKMYSEYLRLIDIVREKNQASGFKSQVDLYKPFIGNEGKKVEVEYKDGEKERFYIGKSTGWIPCHIMVKQSNSHGGGSVLGSLIKNFRFI